MEVITMKKVNTVLTVLIFFLFVSGIKCNANENGWIYYSNVNDSGRLYKIRNDGSDMTRLSMQTAKDIELLGGWIYYYNSSQTGGAFRTKTDGSKTEKLVDGFENECYGIYKDGGHIYIPYMEGNKISYGEPGIIYSCVLIYDENDNASKIDINAAENSVQTARCIEVSNDRIYFSLKEDYFGETDYYALKLNFEKASVNEQKTVKIKKLPAAVSKKAENKKYRRSDTDFYRDKYLCWKEVKGAEKYIVYRIDPKSGKYRKLAETDDTEISIAVANSEYNGKYKVTAVKAVNNATKQYKVKILDNMAYEFSAGSFAAGYKNTYFYCGKNGIYCGSEKISSKEADCICIANEKLYFVSRGHIYKMDTDGSEETMITSIYDALGYNADVWLEVSCISSFDDKVIVSFDTDNENHDVYTMIISPDNDYIAEIINMEIKDICSVNNKLIFTGSDDLIYSMNRDGSDICCISENTANSLCCYKNKVYYCNDGGIFAMNCDGTDVKRIYETNARDIAVCNDRIYFVEMYEKELSPIEYHACSISIDDTELTEYMSDNYVNFIEAYGEYIFIGDIWGNCYVLNDV